MKKNGPQVIAALAVISSFLSVLTGPGVRAAQPEEAQVIVITLQNHVFQPTEIHIPSHQKTEIMVKNLDPTPEEFESGALKIEKVIPAHGEGVVHLRPMDHGHYTFVGEYHEKTARGVIIAD